MLFEISQVAKVYSGKPGCCCGCKGTYSYAAGQLHADWQGKENPRQVKRVFNLIWQHADQAAESENHIFLELDGRWYIAYFKGE